MDFLRRLDPGRAAAPGAARLDMAPRWTEPAAALPAALERPGATVAPSATPPLRAPAAWVSIEHERVPRNDPDPARNEATGAPMADPPRLAPGAVDHPSAVRPATALAARPATASEVVGPAARVDRAGLHTTQARPAPTQEADVRPRPRTQPSPAGSPPPHAVPDRPLRAEALGERGPRAAGEPTVVHVTIDRIDVRLPAADAAPSSRERRLRATSVAAPLSEYLRGPQRGGRG